MSFNIKHFTNFNLILVFLTITNCQIQEPNKNHGILFLENRSKKIVVNKSNKNDIVKIIGQPHSKSINNEDIWIYLERTLTKGKYHKLGKHVLKENNTLVLQFDKYGILTSKKFYDLNDIKNIEFSKNKTNNELTKKSFVESFLSSVRQKMYGNKD